MGNKVFKRKKNKKNKEEASTGPPSATDIGRTSFSDRIGSEMSMQAAMDAKYDLGKELG